MNASHVSKCNECKFHQEDYMNGSSIWCRMNRDYFAKNDNCLNFMEEKERWIYRAQEL